MFAASILRRLALCNLFEKSFSEQGARTAFIDTMKILIKDYADHIDYFRVLSV